MHGTDLESLFYPWMIQAGIQRFRVCGWIPDVVKKSEFLAHHYSYMSPDESCEISGRTRNLIRQHLAHATALDWVAAKESANSLSALVTALVTALVFSLKYHTAVILVSFPDVEVLRQCLHPKLFVPIKVLLDAFGDSRISTPAPQYEILEKDVRAFHEVISSDLFNTYTRKHTVLHDATAPLNGTLHEIVRSGSALQNRFSDRLRQSQLLVNLLHLCPTFIESFCGKLPGSMAKYLADHMALALRQNRRIPIYRFDPVINDLWEGKLSKLDTKCSQRR